MIDVACLQTVAQFYVAMHISLHTVPNLVITDELKRPGFYANSTTYLRPDADCGVLAHERFHHFQEEQGGKARNPVEYAMREQAAHVFEQMFRAHVGEKDD